MVRGFRLISLSLLLVFFALPVLAKTLYVSDTLSVNVRSEPVQGSPAVKLLRSNASLEILGEEGDFYKVRLRDGTEGYFPKRYTTATEPRTRVISRLEKKIKGLEAELEALKGRLGAEAGELEAERAKLIEKLGASEARFSELESRQTDLMTERDAALQKYEQLASDAENVVQLANERDELASDNTKLKAEVEALGKENESLLTSGVVKWFLAGAGVLFFGWLIGRASRRKRSGFSGY
jgi:SH3 domain protein